MSVIAITQETFDKMIHAIGIKKGKDVTLEDNGKYKAYRNHYTAAPWGEHDWNRLVDCGFATAHKEDCVPAIIYQLTREGLNFLEGFLGFEIEVMD